MEIWHCSTLTGSCLLHNNSFIQENNLQAEMTKIKNVIKNHRSKITVQKIFSMQQPNYFESANKLLEVHKN